MLLRVNGETVRVRCWDTGCTLGISQPLEDPYYFRQRKLILSRLESAHNKYCELHLFLMNLWWQFCHTGSYHIGMPICHNNNFPFHMSFHTSDRYAAANLYQHRFEIQSSMEQFNGKKFTIVNMCLFSLFVVYCV